MKFTFLKGVLIVSVFGLLALVPLNSNLIFGYNNTTDTPTCSKEKPSQVVLYEPNHALLPRATGVGEIRLNWLKTAKANKYTVGFGVNSGNYIYGASDVGDTDHFIVRFLAPGKRYFFAVRGVNDCKPGDWSREWSAVVGRGGGVTIVGNTVPSPILRRPGNGALVSPTVIQNRLIPTVIPTEVIPSPVPTQRPGFFQRFLRIFGIGG